MLFPGQSVQDVVIRRPLVFLTNDTVACVHWGFSRKYKIRLIRKKGGESQFLSSIVQ